MKKQNTLILSLTLSLFLVLNPSPMPGGKAWSQTATNNNDKKTIVIIGGGMAGVSAATFLRDTKHEIHLFEKEDNLGGHAQTRIVSPGEGYDDVAVDLGPQYFAKGGWDTYIKFLKILDLYNIKDRTSFKPSIAIFSQHKISPYFVSPSLKRRSMKYSLSVKNLYRSTIVYKVLLELNKLYRRRSSNTSMTVGEWLKKLGYSKTINEQIIKPLLVSVSNNTLEKIESSSILHLTQGLAFRSPLDNIFYVSNIGIGQLIQNVAQKLVAHSPNVHVHTSAGIEDIQQVGDKYLVKSANGTSVLADKVIMAVHPHQASAFLKKSSDFADIVPVLDQFEYAKVNIAIHKDKTYIRPELQSFYNVKVDDAGQFNLSMSLGAIHPKYGHLIKSWIYDSQELEKLKKSGNLVATTEFYHPIVTPKFVKLQHELKDLLNKKKNVWMIGGWTTLFESQNSAILSAFEAVKDFAPEETVKYWTKVLPKLEKRQYVEDNEEKTPSVKPIDCKEEK